MRPSAMPLSQGAVPRDIDAAHAQVAMPAIRDAAMLRLQRTVNDLVVHIELLESCVTTKQDVKYTDEKVDALERAHALIQESKDINKVLNGMLGKKADQSVASIKAE